MGLRRNPKIIFQGAFGSTNLNDSTVYYFGSLFGVTTGTTADTARIVVPCKCKIRKAHVFILAFTTAGSNEDVVMVIRKNNTTDSTLETKGLDPSKRTVFSNDNMDLDLDAGDYIEIKFTTPAWATNPVGVYGSALIYAEVLE